MVVVDVVVDHLTMTPDERLRTTLDAARTAATPQAACAVIERAFVDEPALTAAAILHHAHTQVLVAAGRFDDAVAAAERAVDLAPHIAEFHGNLGSALLAQVRRDGPQSPALARAVDVLTTAVACRPHTPQVRSTLAVALTAAGRHDEAIAVCDENLAQFADDAPTMFNKASALVAAGKQAEAVALLESLSSTFPPAATALHKLKT
jgi:Flp pilus assembly protein TadD